MQVNDYLKQYGFSSVVLPNDAIRPLQVLVKQGNHLRRIGDKVRNLFVEGDQGYLPPIKKNVHVAALSGTASRKLDLNAQVSLLEQLMALLKTKLSSDFSLQRDRELHFKFEDPTLDEVESLTALDAYLNHATVREGTTFGDMLLQDDIYIVTSVIKSNKFSVEVSKKRNTDLSIAAPVAGEVVSADVELHTAGESEQTVQYQGAESLVFGVQYVRIQYKRSLLSAIFGKKGVFKIVFDEGLVVKSDEDIKIETLGEAPGLVLEL